MELVRIDESPTAILVRYDAEEVKKNNMNNEFYMYTDEEYFYSMLDEVEFVYRDSKYVDPDTSFAYESSIYYHPHNGFCHLSVECNDTAE